jgi:hypothetical protein
MARLVLEPRRGHSLHIYRPAARARPDRETDRVHTCTRQCVNCDGNVDAALAQVAGKHTFKLRSWLVGRDGIMICSLDCSGSRSGWKHRSRVTVPARVLIRVH